MKKLVTYISIFNLIPLITLAQIVNPLGMATTLDTIPQFLQATLGVVVTIGTMILVMMIIYSGYLFVTAQGNMENLKKAKHTIKWAVIGGAVLLDAWALSVGIQDTIATL